MSSRHAGNERKLIPAFYYYYYLNLSFFFYFYTPISHVSPVLEPRYANSKEAHLLRTPSTRYLSYSCGVKPRGMHGVSGTLVTGYSSSSMTCSSLRGTVARGFRCINPCLLFVGLLGLRARLGGAYVFFPAPYSTTRVWLPGDRQKDDILLKNLKNFSCSLLFFNNI